MKKIIVLFFSMLMVSGCGAGAYSALPTGTPTPSAMSEGDLLATMMMMQIGAKATEQSVGLRFTSTALVVQETQRVEATQAALAVTEQARRDAQATDQQARADTAATQQARDNMAATEQARADAAAAAEQARIDAQATSTAQQQAIWNAATMQVMPTHDMWTAQAVANAQALATNEIELSNLQVEQQRQKNSAEWLVPFLIALACTAVGSLYVMRRSRTREVTNEETGVVEGLLLDNALMIRPQLMTGPLMQLDGSDVVDAKEQSEVTRRAQAVEALRAMPTASPTATGAAMTNSVFGSATAAQRFTVLSPTETPPMQLLGDEARSAIDRDWKENHE